MRGRPVADHIIYGYRSDAYEWRSANSVWLRPEFNATTDRIRYDITDAGSTFDGDDANNEIGDDSTQSAVKYDADGNVLRSGQVYLEETYLLDDGVNPPIRVWVVEGGGELSGFLTDGEVQPGVEYTLSTPVNVTSANAPTYDAFNTPTYDPAQANDIDGGTNHDSLLGGGGDDTIHGASGTDTIYGGDGDDSLNGDTDRDYLYGEDGADSLRGGGGNDELRGGAGDDVLDGDSGDDLLEGGAGSDTLSVYYGEGTDTIVGGDGAGDYDELELRDNGSGVGVSVVSSGEGAGTYTFTDAASSGSFEGIERLIGTSEDDEFDTTADGSDLHIGAGAGDDVIEYGSGDNVIDGDAGDDLIDGAAGGGHDRIDAGAGDDTVRGGGGRDTIQGGTGRDSLTGEGGDDSLTGGDGDDVFGVSDGHDTITDFNAGNSGALGDGDSGNNDFVDLADYYDNLGELRADFDDDGVLNQSNATDAGGAVDYSDNNRFGSSSSLRMQGATRDSFTADNTGVICFALGTSIATVRGPVPVEALRPGDLVTTLEHGPLPVRWVGRRQIGAAELARAPRLRPVRIKPGRLGNARALLVSAQHCLLVEGPGRRAAYARACHLAEETPLASWARGRRSVTYVHVLLDRHATLVSNGIASESFYPGPMAVAALSPRDRRRLLDYLPRLSCDPVDRAYGPRAAPVLSRRDLGHGAVIAAIDTAERLRAV